MARSVNSVILASMNRYSNYAPTAGSEQLRGGISPAAINTPRIYQWSQAKVVVLSSSPFSAIDELDSDSTVEHTQATERK
jgi:hypothetical protein